MLYREDLVSDLSLHVLQALRSALWVVGYGHAYSSYTCTGSALDIMEYRLAKAKSLVTN